MSDCNKRMDLRILKYVLLALLALQSASLEAQKKGYAPGFVVLPEGDTIKGLVKDRSTGMYTDLFKRIRFKSERSLLRKTYSPDQILGYACGDRIYASFPLWEESAFFRFRYYLDEGKEKVFLRVIAANQALTYYRWEYMDADSNYLDYIPLFYRPGSGEMVRVTQGVLGLKRNRLMEYFWDCWELVEALRTKQLNEIDEVYDFYNNYCVEP